MKTATFTITATDEQLAKFEMAFASETSPKQDEVKAIMKNANMTLQEAYTHFIWERALTQRFDAGVEREQRVINEAVEILAKKSGVSVDAFRLKLGMTPVVVVPAQVEAK